MVYNADVLYTSGSYMIPGNKRSETTENGSEHEL